MKNTIKGNEEKNLGGVATESQEYGSGPYLKRIPHSPAEDVEIENYARGVMRGIMEHATANAVGSLLARIRSDAQTIQGLRAHVKDLAHDVQAAVDEAEWKHRQGDEYGSY